MWSHKKLIIKSYSFIYDTDNKTQDNMSGRAYEPIKSVFKEYVNVLFDSNFITLCMNTNVRNTWNTQNHNVKTNVDISV